LHNFKSLVNNELRVAPFVNVKLTLISIKIENII
jgi:hypothetical protein